MESKHNSCEFQDRMMLLDLTARYALSADYPDRMDYLIEDLFAPDGVYNLPQLNFRAEGRAQIGKFAQLVRAAKRQMHHIQANHHFRINGDRATGICEFNEMAVGGGEIVNYSHGLYEDEYIKIDGEWFFASRTTHISEDVARIMTSDVNKKRIHAIIDRIDQI